jgi:GNAT superfamily N-acetyltransferase
VAIYRENAPSLQSAIASCTKDMPVGHILTIHTLQDNSLVLGLIYIPQQYRNRGYATRLMDGLCHYFDEQDIVVYLDPTDLFGSNMRRLTHWYQQYGFRINTNPQREYLMVRDPSVLQ